MSRFIPDTGSLRTALRATGSDTHGKGQQRADLRIGVVFFSRLATLSDFLFYTTAFLLLSHSGAIMYFSDSDLDVDSSEAGMFWNTSARVSVKISRIYESSSMLFRS